MNKKEYKLEKFIELNEDRLLEIWDSYKFEKYEGEYFHHDNVDYFNEELFNDMSSDILFEIEEKRENAHYELQLPESLNYNVLFEYIEKNNIHVQRKDYKGALAYVVFTRGFQTRECSEIEEVFMKHGLICLSRDFDRTSGNTISRYIPQAGKEVYPE